MIARYYEASYSGLIYFVTNSFALVVALASLSLESGVAYYAASKEIATSSLANFCFTWSILATVVSFVILKIAVEKNLLSPLYGQHYFSAVCYISGCMLVNFFSTSFYALKNFATPNIIMSVINLTLIGIIPFAGTSIISESSYIHIYFGGFLVQGISVAIVFYVQNGQFRAKFFPSKHSLKKIFKYGLIAFLANLLFFLVYRVDYWFVEKHCTPEALGNYIQVSKLAQMLLILPSIMASAVFPAIVTNEENKLIEKIKIIARSSLLLYIFICGFLTATGHWLFPFIFGKSFSEMYVTFLLLVPGILSLAMLYPVTAFYAGVKKISLNIIALLLALTIILSGNILLTPKYGIAGAAAASTAGYFTYHIFLTGLFRKKYAIHIKDFYGITMVDFYRVKEMILEKIRARNQDSKKSI
jgi:O-antigen/teichoic acid export membrane protein